MKVNLSNLFNYYKFSLEIEEILSIQVKPSEINLINQVSISKTIYKDFGTACKEKSFFNFKVPTEFNNKILKEVKQVSIDSEYLEFFHEMMFLEKTLNYCSMTNKPLNESSQLETDPNFSYSVNVVYEYAIFFGLIKPNERNKDYFVPLFILSFHSRDQENKVVTQDVIFEQIKKAMGIEYDVGIDAKCLYNSVLSLNPIIIQGYDCKGLDFDFTNIEESLKKIDLYLRDNKLPINNKHQFKKEVYLCACPSGMTKGLIRVYDAVLKTSPNNLINKYFAIHPNKISEINSDTINTADIITTESIVKSYSKHIGAFDNKSLADTQRVALSCFLNGSSSILPVNGAPGTGKTSLLRGIFGQYIVAASIESYQTFIRTKTIMRPIIQTDVIETN